MPEFRSFEFKLVVLEDFLDDELTGTLRELGAHWDPDAEDNWPPRRIPEVERYLRELVLTEEQLAGVTELEFDGGLEIYQLLLPRWDGEGDEFDVTDLTDVALLPNLELFTVAALIPDTVDVQPLLAAPSLRSVSWWLVDQDEALTARFEQAGVTVEP